MTKTKRFLMIFVLPWLADFTIMVMVFTNNSRI